MTAITLSHSYALNHDGPHTGTPPRRLPRTRIHWPNATTGQRTAPRRRMNRGNHAHRLHPLAMLLVLVACEEAAPPKATLPSVPPAAAEPAEPTAGDGGVNPTAPLPTGGSGSTPLPTVTNNIVFEILPSPGPSRSASTIALPAIDGARQESIIGGTLVSAQFPEGFTHSWNSTYRRHQWRREETASAITADWMANGGSVLVSYSFDSGSTWLATFDGSDTYHFYPIPSWGLDESAGVQRQSR